MLPDLDRHLDEFIDAHVNNFIKWDLVVFFHQHPETVDNIPAIATRLGRRREDVSEALEGLVDSGILARETGANGQNIYAFKPGPERGDLVETFIGALDSREHRLQILTKLLRMGART